MIEKIKLLAVKYALNKYALGWLVKVWGKAQGYKTLIFGALSLIVFVLKVGGYIPPELEQAMQNHLHAGVNDVAIAGGVGAIFSFLEKLKRYEPVIDQLIEDIRKQKEGPLP